MKTLIELVAAEIDRLRVEIGEVDVEALPNGIIGAVQEWLGQDELSDLLGFVHPPTSMAWRDELRRIAGRGLS